jgi:hypothetical protein
VISFNIISLQRRVYRVYRVPTVPGTIIEGMERKKKGLVYDYMDSYILVLAHDTTFQQRAYRSVS